jgi:glutathione S-transferase
MKIYAAYGGPPIIKGLVRDLRPIWALEEIGADYEIEWLDTSKQEQKSDGYRAINPFGKVPSMVDGDVTLFESGAICLYLAQKHGALGGPAGSANWSKVLQWSFAALDTIMPPLFDHFLWSNFWAEKPGAADATKSARELAALRFGVLEGALVGRTFLASDDLTVADILMGAALRNGLQPDIIGDHPNLRAYMDRLYARPAFERAYALNLAGPGEVAA